MLCKRCNNLIPDDSTFCRYCGEKVSPEAAPAGNINDAAPAASTEYVPSKKKSHKVLIISCVVLLGLIVLGIVAIPTVALPYFKNILTNNPDAREKMIEQTVKQVKATQKLPAKIDEVTTWVDVTAQPDAIRYHYVISGMDTSQLSNEILKDYLGVICENKASNLLKLNINMEYSYTVEESPKKFFVVMTKDDCGF